MTQNMWVSFLGASDQQPVDPTGGVKLSCNGVKDCATTAGADSGAALAASYGLPPQVGAIVGGFIGGQVGGALESIFSGDDCQYSDAINDVSLLDEQTATLARYNTAVVTLSHTADVLYNKLEEDQVWRDEDSDCFPGVGGLRNAIFYGYCRGFLTYLSENPGTIPEDAQIGLPQPDLGLWCAPCGCCAPEDKMTGRCADVTLPGNVSTGHQAGAPPENAITCSVSTSNDGQTSGSGSGGSSSSSHTGLAVAGLVVAAGAAWVFRDKIKKWVH